MAAVIQIKRRTGSPGAPPSLAAGELAYNDPGDDEPDALYIGTAPAAVRPLVSAARQVELEGEQTITGAKTIAIADLRLLGGAENNIIMTDGAGNLSFTAAPGGGIIAVATDDTLDGDGNETPLSVVALAEARDFDLQATGGTEITTVTASFDGTAAAIITGFEITGLDGGVY